MGETVLVKLLTLYTVIEWHVGGLAVLKIRGCRIEQIRTTERLIRAAIYSRISQLFRPKKSIGSFFLISFLEYGSFTSDTQDIIHFCLCSCRKKTKYHLVPKSKITKIEYRTPIIMHVLVLGHLYIKYVGILFTLSVVPELKLSLS